MLRSIELDKVISEHGALSKKTGLVAEEIKLQKRDEKVNMSE